MLDVDGWQPDAVLPLIQADADAGRLSDWASSTVLDEVVGQPVLPQALVERLHAAAGIPSEFPVGNAGILHVYGYWFSSVPTPYGYKRDRWLDGRLATALGRPADEFLLTGEASRTPLHRVTAATLPLLRTPPDHSLAVVDEAVGGLRARTVLVRIPETGPAALVYGVDEGTGWRLVTAFPVDGDPLVFAAELSAGPARLRWNAVAPRET